MFSLWRQFLVKNAVPPQAEEARRATAFCSIIAYRRQIHNRKYPLLPPIAVHSGAAPHIYVGKYYIMDTSREKYLLHRRAML